MLRPEGMATSSLYGKHEKPYEPHKCVSDCRVNEIVAMTRNHLIDALIEAEEELAIANTYIETLTND